MDQEAVGRESCRTTIKDEGPEKKSSQRMANLDVSATHVATKALPSSTEEESDRNNGMGCFQRQQPSSAVTGSPSRLERLRTATLRPFDSRNKKILGTIIAVIIFLDVFFLSLVFFSSRRKCFMARWIGCDNGRTLPNILRNERKHRGASRDRTSNIGGRVGDAAISRSNNSSKRSSVRGGGAGTNHPTRAGLSWLSLEFARRLLVSAVVTLSFEAAIGHILEFVKISMQTSPAGTTYRSILRHITSEKGVVGLWDGFVPWGIFQAVLKGGVFGVAYSAALSLLTPLAEEGRLFLPNERLVLTLASGIAGGVEGCVLSPTLLLKTRVMTDDSFRRRTSGGALETTIRSFEVGWRVIRNEGGFCALMKGSPIFALKRLFDWSSRYYFSDVFALQLSDIGNERKSLTPATKIIADLLGGAVSTIVTLPMDVVVAKMQDAKRAGIKAPMWSIFSDELKEGGWQGVRDRYLLGFWARLVHVCLATVAMKSVTVFLYNVMFKTTS